MLSATGLSPRFPGDLLGLPAFWGGPRRVCVSGSPWAGALTVLFTLPFTHWGKIGGHAGGWTTWARALRVRWLAVWWLTARHTGCYLAAVHGFTALLPTRQRPTYECPSASCDGPLNKRKSVWRHSR